MIMINANNNYEFYQLSKTPLEFDFSVYFPLKT